MNPQTIAKFWTSIGLLTIGLVSAVSLQAQEPGLVETFDDPDLPGWEHSPEVAIIDGALHVPAHGYAFHGGEWRDMTLTVRAQRAGPGPVTIGYQVSDEGAFHITVEEDSIALLHKTNQMSAFHFS